MREGLAMVPLVMPKQSVKKLVEPVFLHFNPNKQLVMHLEHSYLFLKVGGNKYSERFPTFGRDKCGLPGKDLDQ